MRYNNGNFAIVDDMPLLSQWIKNTRSHERVFFGTDTQNGTDLKTLDFLKIKKNNQQA